MFEFFDAVLAARLQFAFTIAFHIIFPALSIGLAWYLMVLQGLWLKTGRDIYRRVWRYWVKVFAVVFGMGVVSGIVMSYQIGTNWSVFSDKTGPILGPLMGLMFKKTIGKVMQKDLNEIKETVEAKEADA